MGGRPGRRARVNAGIRELLIWLEDQLSTGLARLQPEAYRRFDTMGARLVDAQAPGLATRVRALVGVVASGPGWNDRLLAELAQLYSLARAHQRLDELPESLAATVRTHVGYPVAKASVLAGPAVTDAWYVIGRRDEYDGVLATRRTWLLGGRTSRPALVLSFAARGQRLDDSLQVGTMVLADLHFYPGSLPLRALVGTWHGVLDLDEPGLPDGSGRPEAPRPANTPLLANGPGPPAPPPAMTLAQVRRRWATCVERDPWVRRCAVVVAVAPAQARAAHGSHPPNDAVPNDPVPNAAAADAPVVWRDADGDVIPQAVTTGAGSWPATMRPRSGVPGTPTAVDLRWVALAVGGGDPVPLCAEIDDRGLTPLAVWTPDGALTDAGIAAGGWS